MKFYSKLLILLLLTICTYAQSQSLEELRRRKEKTAEEINFTSKLLNETGTNLNSSLNKLSLFTQQIELRNKLISDYNTQIILLEDSILKKKNNIDSLSKNLSKIKQEYAFLIENTYKTNKTNSTLTFFLSSNSFNQAYKRLTYLRQISEYRQKQALEIIENQEELKKKIEEINSDKKSAEEVVLQRKVENEKLANEKQNQSEIYKSLKSKEADLRKTLHNQRKIEEKLQNEIERLIAEEIRKSKKSKSVNTEQRVLSDNFQKNRGILPWPVERGVITDRFGEHAHPILKKVTVRNNGIDITTNSGVKARAVFKGIVSVVFVIPGGNSAVILRHGEYLTVYSNLIDVFVKKGDNVSTKQELGTIDTDPKDGKTVLKFQIRKDNDKLNPEEWLQN